MKNLITCLIVCTLSGTTFADTWTVDDDGKADFDNIQAAVDASSDGDEIVVMPGTYTGIGDQVVDMLGKEIWLHSSGGAEVTIIDGEETRRGIYCNNYETSTTIIEGFTITNGYRYGSGGGMSNGYGSSPTIKNCTFENNRATSYGGGMSNTGSQPTLDGCTFTNNTAAYGGGMDSYNSNPTLTDCTFKNNTAGNGGGMYNENSSPTLTDCPFENNTAYNHGGGMYNTGSQPTLENCTFTNNTASDGGGMATSDINSICTLTNCTFTGNTASDDGGGMYNSSEATLTNCTFSGNNATGIYSKGGGIYSYLSNVANKSMILTGCSITNNTASDSGGGLRSSTNGPINGPTLIDTVVCNNSPDQINGTYTDGGGVCIGELCEDTDGDGIPDICNLDCNGNGIPDFEDIAGGTSEDCDENGVPDECDTDINENGIPDNCEEFNVFIVLGGFEIDPPPTGFGDIQSAVDAAVDGDVILVWPTSFGNGMPYTAPMGDYPSAVIEVSNKSIMLLAMTELGEVVIDGEGSNIGIICTGSNSSVVLDGFIFENCGENDHPGGGMFCYDNSPTIRDCTFRYNNSDTVGGGMYFNQNSSPVLIRCNISNNSATIEGGGIYCASGQMTIVDSEICANMGNQIEGQYIDGGGNLVCDEPIIWTVDDDGKADFASIQDAVDASSEGDEILVYPGTYTSSQDGQVVKVSKQYLTIRSVDPNDPAVVDSTIIDGQDARRGFACVASERILRDNSRSTWGTLLDKIDMSHLELQRRDVDTSVIEPVMLPPRGDHYRNYGGGIGHVVPESSIKIEGFTIINGYGSEVDYPYNLSTTDGGGILSIERNLFISKCHISDNNSTAGGGIFVAGVPDSRSTRARVTGCQIEENAAFRPTTHWWNPWGGGICAIYSEVEIEDCIIRNNVSQYVGGGVGVWSGNLSLINCTIENNISEDPSDPTPDVWAGGVAFAANYENRKAVVNGCSFIGNVGLYGGALQAQLKDFSTIVVNNCTFDGNVAIDDGGVGGAFLSNFQGNDPFVNPDAGPWHTITNCEFTNNSAQFGGAISFGFDNFADYYEGGLVSGCLIESNFALVSGGGISFIGDGDNLSIDNSILCDNTPDQIYGDYTDAGGNTINLCFGGCPDLSGNGIVGIEDLLAVVGDWGASDSAFDVNSDGIVDVLDLLIIMANWGPCE